MELSKKHLVRTCTGFAAIAALALSGCSATSPSGGNTPSPSSSSSAPSQSLDQIEAQLYEAAKAEGAVTLYSSAVQSAAEAMTKAFEAKFPGIKVTYSLGNVSQNLTKLTQENSAGVHNADILALSAPGQTQDFVKAGLVVPYKVHDYDAYPSTARGDNDVHELFDKYTAYGTIVYNTNLMKQGDVPNSFAEFFNLDPAKYAGKIVINDITLYPYTNNLAVWQAAVGDTPLQNLKNLKIVTDVQSSTISNGIASGQYLLTPTFNMQTYVTLKKTGAPIDFKVPTEGIWLQPGSHLLVKDAPHPNAAKLFMEFIYSAEGQRLWSAPGYVSPRPDVALPTGLEWVKDAKVINIDFAKTYADRDAITAEAKALLGRS